MLPLKEIFFLSFYFFSKEIFWFISKELIEINLGNYDYFDSPKSSKTHTHTDSLGNS